MKIVLEILNAQFEEYKQRYDCLIGNCQDSLEFTYYWLLDSGVKNKVNLKKKDLKELKIINKKLDNMFEKLKEQRKEVFSIKENYC